MYYDPSYPDDPLATSLRPHALDRNLKAYVAKCLITSSILFAVEEFCNHLHQFPQVGNEALQPRRKLKMATQEAEAVKGISSSQESDEGDVKSTAVPLPRIERVFPIRIQVSSRQIQAPPGEFHEIYSIWSPKSLIELSNLTDYTENNREWTISLQTGFAKSQLRRRAAPHLHSSTRANHEAVGGLLCYE